MVFRSRCSQTGDQNKHKE